MARPVKLYVTANGATPVYSPVAPLNTYGNPFNVGLAVAVSGTITYTVEHTFDDVFAPGFDPANATWYDTTSLTGLSAKQDGNYAFSATGVRIKSTAGSGSAVLTIIQSGY
jgi:hypothetical protein